jgi:3',5'-cyclic AMP phosphodiesterase CpdA
MQQNSLCLRIAHLSDPHFSHLTYHPRQFLSKRWLGNLNLFLFRKQAYQTAHLWHLPELIESLDTQFVLITGDFSSTSLDQEFADGKKFVAAFTERNLPTYVVPGNHDCYTKDAEKQQNFSNFFPAASQLKEKKVECHSLKYGWWYIGLDCAVATPLFCAYGYFSETIEKNLLSILENIPKEDKVIIANHFPLFPSGRPKHDLKRAKVLQKIVKRYPQIKLYLHGHDHRYYVANRQHEGFPLVLNSGSCAHKPDGTFFLIDLFEQECLVQRLLFRKENETFSWVIDWQRHYSFSREKPCRRIT